MNKENEDVHSYVMIEHKDWFNEIWTRLRILEDWKASQMAQIKMLVIIGCIIGNVLGAIFTLAGEYIVWKLLGK